MEIKNGLRLVIDETRAAEAAELVPLCDDTPRPAGRWSARDNLAHLAAWRDHAASLLEAIRSGEKPPVESTDFDEQNREIFEAIRDLTAAEVKSAAEQSWVRLSAALDACSETELHQPRPGRTGQQVWEAVPGNTHLHLAEHLGYMHAEAGHAAAAEAAATWRTSSTIEPFPATERALPRPTTSAASTLAPGAPTTPFPTWRWDSRSTRSSVSGRARTLTWTLSGMIHGSQLYLARSTLSSQVY